MNPSKISDRLLRSSRYHHSALDAIAGGVNSNVRFHGSFPPLCFLRAHGAHLTDLDGNTYVDYALGMGPAILGHGATAIVEGVARSLSDGQLVAGQTAMELELARRIQKYVPGADLIRIGTTGTELVQVALRVARAATGRERIVKFAGHYHGWLDNVLTNEVTFSAHSAHPGKARPQTGGQSEAALSDTTVLRWNDLDALNAYADRFGAHTAAIIMEPVLCNTGVISPLPGYLAEVRRLCDKYGIIFIVDEVVTGFRLGLGGAQSLLGVTGDLTILAKALGGGVPIAALSGRRHLMSLIASGQVNHSGTYNSGTLALAAAIATIDSLSSNEGAAYGRIAQVGTQLMEGLRDLAYSLGDNLIVQGYPSVFNTAFGSSALSKAHISTVEEYRQCDDARQTRFLQVLLEHGVRPTARGTWFVSAAHTSEDVITTLAAAREALQASRLRT